MDFEDGVWRFLDDGVLPPSSLTLGRGRYLEKLAIYSMREQN